MGRIKDVYINVVRELEVSEQSAINYLVGLGWSTKDALGDVRAVERELKRERGIKKGRMAMAERFDQLRKFIDWVELHPDPHLYGKIRLAINQLEEEWREEWQRDIT